jgi:hypothetical protein
MLAAVETFQDQFEAAHAFLGEEIRNGHHLNEIVGKSSVLMTALHKVELVGPTD